MNGKTDQDTGNDWDILEGLTYLVARTFDIPKSEAGSQAAYLFSITDIMLSARAGQTIGLTEAQTVTAMVWNQWFDLHHGSTKLQRFFDRTLRDHYSRIDKILSQFGGNLSPELARDFRKELKRVYVELSVAKFREFTSGRG